MTFNTRLLAVIAAVVWSLMAAVTHAADTHYIIFFDYDSAVLIPAGKDVAKEAAQTYKDKGAARIDVAGHTDTAEAAGSAPTLSKQRADAIAAELSRLGVPASAITAEGRGAREPLAPTGPATREPMNRRATITLKGSR